MMLIQLNTWNVNPSMKTGLPPLLTRSPKLMMLTISPIGPKNSSQVMVCLLRSKGTPAFANRSTSLEFSVSTA